MSAALRGLSFVALFQAVGAALFLVIFDPRVKRVVIVRLIHWSAAVAVALITAQYLMEAARMSGDYAGALDANLQLLVAHSSLLLIYLLRALALVLLLIVVRSFTVTPRWTVVVAAMEVAISFALTGHTATRPYNPILSLLLIAHVAVVTFWFGSLLPLLVINRSPHREMVALLVERFSTMAMRTVPILFGAGAVLIVFLFYTPRNFLEPYGLILLGKLVVFALLMGVAAINRWRLGPMLRASAPAARAFSYALLTEFALIAAVLIATAALTTFFSPSEEDDSAAGANAQLDALAPARTLHGWARGSP